MNRPLARGFALIVCAAAAATALGQSHRAIDLGTLDGVAEAAAVNNARTVVGSSVGGRGRFRAFVWDADLTALATPSPFTQAQGMDINSVSRAVIAAYSMGQVGARAVRLNPSGATSDLGDFCPTAINSAGTIVGARDAIDPATGLVTTRAVRLKQGALSDLPALPDGLGAAALDLSNNGLIVGSAFPRNALTPTAVLWRSGHIRKLGTLGRRPAQATSISPSGVYVAGFSATTTAPRHAFRYRLSATGAVIGRRDLGTLEPGGWSVAYDTNNAGQVVGTSDGRAFLYTAGAMIDLNTLISPASGWTLVGASGINTQGDIVGWGEHGALGPRAFLLVEVCSQADIAAPYGVLDAGDLAYYISQRDAGNVTEADLTGTSAPGQPGYGVPDGLITNDDFLYYLSLYEAGC